MTNKTISISYDNWQKLTEIKKNLIEKSNNDIHCNDIITHILEENEIYSNIKKKNKLESMPLKSISNPKLDFKLPRDKNSIKKKEKSLKMSDKNFDLNIPLPPKKKPILLDIDKEKLKSLTKKETDDTKYILIECQICGPTPISMPVPKKLVLESPDPIVDISFIHGEPQHVIVAQLDHNFQVRRRRASWVVYEKDYL